MWLFLDTNDMLKIEDIQVHTYEHWEKGIWNPVSSLENIYGGKYKSSAKGAKGENRLDG